jgi:hypothetical protein
MKVLTFAVVALISSTGAVPLEDRASLVLETDALAAQGALNLGANTAQNGYPNPKTCNSQNVAIRREW